MPHDKLSDHCKARAMKLLGELKTVLADEGVGLDSFMRHYAGSDGEEPDEAEELASDEVEGGPKLGAIVAKYKMQKKSEA